jgi:threonine dehydrogenase-like Zn-dependent dehydrogenase
LKAVVWQGPGRVGVERVADARLLGPRDAVVRVTRSAIGGSDLHALRGMLPTMREGDILGREMVGEVVETGPGVSGLARGDRVVAAFAIACGRCFHCTRDEPALCDNSNPNAALAASVYGYAPGGAFGSSHLLGGYAGTQAELVRVPFADTGLFKLPEALGDDSAVLLAEAFPAGWQAAESCALQPGDVIAVWGCGAVGLLAAKSALLQGADRVLAIDSVPERLRLAQRLGAVAVDGGAPGVQEKLRELTAGRGADACIDAAALEGHAPAVSAAIDACRKGGQVVVAGLQGLPLETAPLHAAFAKGLTLHLRPPNAHRLMRPLAQMVADGLFDPAVVVTHHVPLAQAGYAYEVAAGALEGCVKAVMPTA